MERIEHLKHPKHAFIYAFSRLFERASYYGVRAVIVLYMIGESMKMSNEEAITVYGWITGSLLLSQLIGAIFGDLLIGNKRSIIAGGMAQGLGAFCFYLPSTIGLYTGIVLFVVGSGFYTPNMIAHYGKIYLNRKKLLDSGFTILYLAVNIGAFIGAFFIGYSSDIFGFKPAFALAGGFMIVSICFPIFARDLDKKIVVAKAISFNRRVFKIVSAFLLVGLFWTVYEVADIGFFDIQQKLSESSSLKLPKGHWTSFSSSFILPLSLIAIVVWSYYYNSHFIKLTAGFIAAAISFGVLYFIPENPSDNHLFIYIISLLFLGISEVHIAPVINSILTRYSNPKYLAIIMSLTFIPYRLLNWTVGLFNSKLYEDPSLAIQLALIGMVALSLILILYLIFSNRSKKFV